MANNTENAMSHFERKRIYVLGGYVLLLKCVADTMIKTQTIKIQ